MNQEQLSKALFPIGDLKKTEVRALAKKIGLNTAEKKDSQGLCFIGKVKLPVFLQQQLKPKKGKVIEIDRNHETFKVHNNSHSSYVLDSSMGKIVGEHEGAHYFTIGQRKGLNIGGTPLPLFIIGTNTQENIIYVGQGDDHPGLYRKGLTVKNDDVHWIREGLKLEIGESKNYQCRIRYRQALTEAKLIQNNDELLISFIKPQRGITPGQFVAWYKNDELIGSGVIN